MLGNSTTVIDKGEAIGFRRKRLEDVRDYCSYARLKAMRSSMQHFKMRYLDGIKVEQTPEMRFGEAFHLAVLEPDEYLRRVLFKPRNEGSVHLETAQELKDELARLGLRNTGTKAELERRLVEHDPALYERRLFSNVLATYQAKMDALGDDALELTLEQAMRLGKMLESVNSHPLVPTLLSDGQPETHAYWWDEELAVLWYCRLDYVRLTPERAWVTELKTTTSAAPWSFANDIKEHAYHLQNWIYRRVVFGITRLPVNLVQVVCEKSPPYIVECYTPDERSDEAAEVEVRRLLEQYRRCEQTGFWTGYTDGRIYPLGLPNYEYWRLEEHAERFLIQQPLDKETMRDI